MPGWTALPLGAAAGLVLGSFAVTAGLRVSRAEGVVAGRSRCDHCGHSLAFRQTIPVISYVALRGACAHCGGRIDPLHLVGEIAGAVVVVSALSEPDPLKAGLAAALGLTLIAAAAVDARVQRLPDVLTGLVAATGLLLAVLGGRQAVLAGAIAAILAVGVLLAVRALSGRHGRESLGLGDVKLVAALALWLGAATPLMVSLAALLGLAATGLLRLPRRIAFGPYIALSGWAVGLALQAGWSPWAL